MARGGHHVERRRRGRDDHGDGNSSARRERDGVGFVDDRPHATRSPAVPRPKRLHHGGDHAQCRAHGKPGLGKAVGSNEFVAAVTGRRSATRQQLHGRRRFDDRLAKPVRDHSHLRSRPRDEGADEHLRRRDGPDGWRGIQHDSPQRHEPVGGERPVPIPSRQAEHVLEKTGLFSAAGARLGRTRPARPHRRSLQPGGRFIRGTPREGPHVLLARRGGLFRRRHREHVDRDSDCGRDPGRFFRERIEHLQPVRPGCERPAAPVFQQPHSGDPAGSDGLGLDTAACEPRARRRTAFDFGHTDGAGAADHRQPEPHGQRQVAAHRDVPLLHIARTRIRSLPGPSECGFAAGVRAWLLHPRPGRPCPGGQQHLRRLDHVSAELEVRADLFQRFQGESHIRPRGDSEPAWHPGRFPGQDLRSGRLRGTVSP